MKKLTGPFLLAAALFTHIGIVITTEEAYTFSSSDYKINPTTLNHIDEHPTVAVDLLSSNLTATNAFYSTSYEFKKK